MKVRDKWVLVGSFAVTSLLGGAAVSWFWLGRDLPQTAVTRTGCFVAVMAVLHWIAFRLYRSEPASVPVMEGLPASFAQEAQNASVRSLFSPLAPDYGPAVKRAVIQQVIFLILGALMLDGGYFLRACCVSAIAQWLAITLIVVRRPFIPTKVDLFVARYGFLLVLLFAGWLAPFIQRFLGQRV